MSEVLSLDLNSVSMDTESARGEISYEKESIMTKELSKKSLIKRIQELEAAALEKDRHEKINQVLFKISNAVSTTKSLDELYRSIHFSLGRIIDTTNFFIALYDRETDAVVFPYCIDEIDGQLPPVTGISKTGSLTARVICSGVPLLLDKRDIIAIRHESGAVAPTCTPSEIWLGVPLKSKARIVGVMAVQSYTRPGLFDETDMAVMVAVADQVALAIEKKRFEEKQLQLIEKLHAALEEVRTLQGILPICSKCKKIRDDTGYWNQIEVYIQNHSKAMFSHGLCPACSEALYGNERWYVELKKKQGKDGV